MLEVEVLPARLCVAHMHARQLKLVVTMHLSSQLRTSDGSSSVRLDRVSTISGDDEKNRDNYMANFKGGLCSAEGGTRELQTVRMQIQADSMPNRGARAGARASMCILHGCV